MRTSVTISREEKLYITQTCKPTGIEVKTERTKCRNVYRLASIGHLLGNSGRIIDKAVQFCDVGSIKGAVKDIFPEPADKTAKQRHTVFRGIYNADAIVQIEDFGNVCVSIDNINDRLVALLY